MDNHLNELKNLPLKQNKLIPLKNVLLPGVQLGEGNRAYTVENVTNENIYLRAHPNAQRGEKFTDKGVLRIIPNIVIQDIIKGIKQGQLKLDEILSSQKSKEEESRKWIFKKINSSHDPFILGYITIISKICEYYLNHGEDIDVSFNADNFTNAIHKSNISLIPSLSLRFISSLLTKPFVILTGLSGSGKTKLAQAFAMWICENKNQYCLVPVGADWTNREPLLGFPNALKENDYKPDEYGVIKLIIEADDNPEKPYFLILDEMNLSHVERYFADFLSVMESKTKISLHSGSEPWNNIPPEIGFPKNLFIIGTVNIDETTYMFSPKVLDRANVIEFRVTASEMENYLLKTKKVNLQNLEGLGVSMAASFVQIACDNSLGFDNPDELNKELMKFFRELKKTGAEFGYRSASEILRFASVVKKIEPLWSMSEIIDASVMQKLLPKVHGSRRKLEPILRTLAGLCLTEELNADDYLGAKQEIIFSDTAKIKYPISLEKIRRMHDSLISNGFTSYAEA